MDKSTDNQNKNNENVEVGADSEPHVPIEAARDNDDNNLKRRRALIASLAAIPVLITLKSRSAFAQTTPCSIVLSVNLNGANSQHPGTVVTDQQVNDCLANP